jgi:hypothetical protein
MTADIMKQLVVGLGAHTTKSKMDLFWENHFLEQSDAIRARAEQQADREEKALIPVAGMNELPTTCLDLVLYRPPSRVTACDVLKPSLSGDDDHGIVPSAGVETAEPKAIHVTVEAGRTPPPTATPVSSSTVDVDMVLPQSNTADKLRNDDSAELQLSEELHGHLHSSEISAGAHAGNHFSAFLTSPSCVPTMDHDDASTVRTNDASTTGSATYSWTLDTAMLEARVRADDIDTAMLEAPHLIRERFPPKRVPPQVVPAVVASEKSGPLLQSSRLLPLRTSVWNPSPPTLSQDQWNLFNEAARAFTAGKVHSSFRTLMQTDSAAEVMLSAALCDLKAFTLLLKQVGDLGSLLTNEYLYNRVDKLDGNWQSDLFTAFYVAPDSVWNITRELKKEGCRFTSTPTTATHHGEPWWLKVRFLVVTRRDLFVATVTGYYAFRKFGQDGLPQSATRFRFLLKTVYGQRQSLVYDRDDLLLLEPLPCEREVLFCWTDVKMSEVRVICQHSRYLDVPTSSNLARFYTPENAVDAGDLNILGGNAIPLSDLGASWMSALLEPASIILKRDFKVKRDVLFVQNMAGTEIESKYNGMLLPHFLAEPVNAGCCRRWVLLLALHRCLQVNQFCMPLLLSPSLVL